MAKWIHRLTDKNLEEKTATCAECGPNSRIKVPPSGNVRCWNAVRDAQREYKKRHKVVRVPDLRRLHGMTPEQRQALIDSQSGCCAICGRGGVPLGIDHDHTCCPGSYGCLNCVRGALCSSCNVALGHMKDDPRILQNAILYLERERPELG